MIKKLSIMFLLTFLTAISFVSNEANAVETEYQNVLPSNIVLEEKGEFRGAWISHWISSFSSYSTEAKFKQEGNLILDALAYYNYNAVIVHFRTHNNALYESDINPRASWFANVNFNTFDPMKWLIEETHRRGMEFHAWFNPYRLSTGGQISGSMPSSNPQSNPSNILSSGSASILNPGLPNVRQHIFDTIEEVINNYEVDAVHFDDYFYINLGSNGATTGATTILTEPDQQTYIQYGQGYDKNSATDKANWRRAQVDLLVKGVHDLLETHNQTSDRYVQFGISPTGIYKNGNGVVTYDANGMPITTGSQTTGQTHHSSYLFSDSVNWLKNGWLDYILPQTYWATNHPSAGYEKVVGWWDKVVKNLDVNLYSGIGLYFADEANSHNWASDTNEMVNQLNYLKTLENVQGQSIYSIKHVLQGYQNTGTKAATALNKAKTQVLTTKTTLPEIKGQTPIVLPAVKNITHANGKLTFDKLDDAKIYYIYRSNTNLTYANEEILGSIGQQDLSRIEFTTNDSTSNYEYGVRALSKTNTLGDAYDSNVVAPTIALSGNLVDGIYKSQVTVTLTAQDSILYSLDGINYQNYTAPFVVSLNGKYTLYFKAKNNLNEESLIKTRSFEISKANLDVPRITIEGNKIGNDYEVGAKVKLESNSNEIYYKYNHGRLSVSEWTKYTEPFVLNDTTQVSGSYLIFAKTVNSEGMSSNEVQLTVKVVQNYKNPSLQIISGVGKNNYYQSLTLKLDANAPTAQYRINNDAWVTSTNEFTLTNPGDYKVEFRNSTTDTILSQTYTIVENPLDANISYDKEVVNGYFKEKVNVTLSVEDESKIFYRIHNGRTWTSLQEYTEPILFNQSGDFKIEYYSENLAGVKSELTTKYLFMDVAYSHDNQYVIRNGSNVYYYNTTTPVELPTTYTEKTNEFRAVWVSTVSNIDIKQHISEVQYKAEIIQILDTIQKNNFNAMFFQVRPMNDAFYDSAYAPWSRFLAGAEDKDPGWDVLAFIIEEAHKRGIEFHAWMNPYRVSSGTGTKEQQLSTLSDANFAKQNPNYVIQDSKEALILNPGIPAVRQYLFNIIDEIMNKYNIDGVHFDDYFYSYSGTADSEDNFAFTNYNPSSLTRANWRRNNVDILVESIFNKVEAHNELNNKNVKFGISPFGIWKNSSSDPLGSNSRGLESYSAQYADTYKWIKNGWLHYVLPQLYWQFDHSTARFADLVDWWVDVVKDTNVDLIIGHGFYRYAETSNNWTAQYEITEQLRYMSQYEEIIGSSFFSYKTLNSPNTYVVNALKELNEVFWTERPDYTWESQVEAPKPIDPDPTDPNPTDPDPTDPDPVDPEPGVDNKPTLEDILIYASLGAIGITGALVLITIFKKKK